MTDHTITDHTITVTSEGPGRYRVGCSCERLSLGVTDFDLGMTIKVHLDHAADDAPAKGS